DLQGHAIFSERRDSLDPWRLEDATLPGGIAGHLPADVVDDLDRLVDVGAVGDRDVLVDPRPHPGEVGGDADLAIRDRVDNPVQVPQRGPPEGEVLHRPGHAGRTNDVALGKLVLDQDQGTVEIVLDQALRAKADGDANDTESGDRRPDVKAQLTEDHQSGDRHDERLDR